jgi:polo-like kinase 1
MNNRTIKNKNKEYKIGNLLGKGGFANCFEVFDESGERLAVKIVPKKILNKTTAKQKLKTEIKIHKILNHKNIVKFIDVFEDNENVYIILELCDNKSLNELIKSRKRITELEVKYYLFQTIEALTYLKKKRIVHRDLKLGNLFLNHKMEVKIGDFGLANYIRENERRYTICGTPNYIAPEILGSKVKGHSFEVDIWAIGVITYTLLVGRPPFETDSVKKTYTKINKGEFDFPNHVLISEEGKDFICKILIVDPEKRMTINDIKNHPFFLKQNIPNLPEDCFTDPPSKQYLIQVQ